MRVLSPRHAARLVPQSCGYFRSKTWRLSARTKVQKWHARLRLYPQKPPNGARNRGYRPKYGQGGSIVGAAKSGCRYRKTVAPAQAVAVPRATRRTIILGNFCLIGPVFRPIFCPKNRIVLPHALAQAAWALLPHGLGKSAAKAAYWPHGLQAPLGKVVAPGTAVSAYWPHGLGCDVYSPHSPRRHRRGKSRGRPHGLRLWKRFPRGKSASQRHLKGWYRALPGGA